MATLEVGDLYKSYSTRTILDGVTFSVDKGQACVIIGQSGEGKTTLLKCLNLLATIDRGEILLDGQIVIKAFGDRRSPSIEMDPSALRRRIGMVFQEWNLWPNMTIRENISLAPRYVQNLSRRDAECTAEVLCERVRLADKLDVYPHSLSGGQKQRAAIARALAMNPEILMLDEVTSALDPSLAAEVLDVMLEMKRDGRTLIIVTHHMEFARAVADKVLFLHAGRVHETGSASMLTHPQSQELGFFLQQVKRMH